MWSWRHIGQESPARAADRAQVLHITQRRFAASGQAGFPITGARLPLEAQREAVPPH